MKISIDKFRMRLGGNKGDFQIPALKISWKQFFNTTSISACGHIG